MYHSGSVDHAQQLVAEKEQFPVQSSVHDANRHDNQLTGTSDTISSKEGIEKQKVPDPSEPSKAEELHSLPRQKTKEIPDKASMSAKATAFDLSRASSKGQDKTLSSNEVPVSIVGATSSASSISDRGGASLISAGRGLSPSSSIGSLSSDKSTLNPHAKEFKFNPKTSYVPTQTPLRPSSSAVDSNTFYYPANIAGVTHMHGIPGGGGQPVVMFNPLGAPIPQPYYHPNGPQVQYGHQMIRQPRPFMYMPTYSPEMPYNQGRESQSHHVDLGRELERWVPDDSDPGSIDMENIFDGSWNRGWDQIEVNKTLFGVMSTFDEELYTTKLEICPQMRELEREATRLASQIEGEETRDIHVTEERGIRLDGNLDFDEEARFSSVLRVTDDSGCEVIEDALLNSRNGETFGVVSESVIDNPLTEGGVVSSAAAGRDMYNSCSVDHAQQMVAENEQFPVQSSAHDDNRHDNSLIGTADSICIKESRLKQKMQFGHQMIGQPRPFVYIPTYSPVRCVISFPYYLINDGGTNEEELIIPGESGYYAKMEYAIIPYAVIANVVDMTVIGPSDPYVGTIRVEGSLTANGIDFLKDNKFKIRSSHTNDLLYNVCFSRPAIAVPVLSSLRVEISLTRVGTEFASRMLEFYPLWHTKQTLFVDFKDKKHFLRMDVHWVLTDTFFGLHRKIFRPVESDHYVEVFSVFVGGGRGVPCLCGTIVVRDRDESVQVFSRNTECPDNLSRFRRIVSLAWPADRLVLEKDFNMHLNLKDAKGRLVCKGGLSWYDDGGLCPTRFDRRMCAVIPGQDGYFAAVHYSIFRFGLQAKVTVSVECKGLCDNFDVYGSVYGEYNDYDYSSAYDKEYYRLIVFDRPEEYRANVKNYSEIPLSKSLVTAPSDCGWLSVCVSLTIRPFTNSCMVSPDLFAMQNLRFTANTNASRQVPLYQRESGVRRWGCVTVKVDWFGCRVPE